MTTENKGFDLKAFRKHVAERRQQKADAEKKVEAVDSAKNLPMTKFAVSNGYDLYIGTDGDGVRIYNAKPTGEPAPASGYYDKEYCEKVKKVKFPAKAAKKESVIKIGKSGEKWRVYDGDTDKTLGEHKTYKEAREQQKAVYQSMKADAAKKPEGPDSVYKPGYDTETFAKIAKEFAAFVKSRDIKNPGRRDFVIWMDHNYPDITPTAELREVVQKAIWGKDPETVDTTGNDKGKGVEKEEKMAAEGVANPVAIGDGFYIHKVGYDVNGNWSIWVSKGANRAKKIQTNGNAPTAHEQSKRGKTLKERTDTLSDKAKDELKDFYRKYLDKATAAKAEGKKIDGYWRVPLSEFGVEVFKKNGKEGLRFIEKYDKAIVLEPKYNHIWSEVSLPNGLLTVEDAKGVEWIVDLPSYLEYFEEPEELTKQREEAEKERKSAARVNAAENAGKSNIPVGTKVRVEYIDEGRNHWAEGQIVKPFEPAKTAIAGLQVEKSSESTPHKEMNIMPGDKITVVSTATPAAQSASAAPQEVVAGKKVEAADDKATIAKLKETLMMIYNIVTHPKSTKADMKRIAEEAGNVLFGRYGDKTLEGYAMRSKAESVDGADLDAYAPTDEMLPLDEAAKDEIIAYIVDTADIDDDKFHDFIDGLGVDIHEAETFIYQSLRTMLVEEDSESEESAPVDEGNEVDMIDNETGRDLQLFDEMGSIAGRRATAAAIKIDPEKAQTIRAEMTNARMEWRKPEVRREYGDDMIKYLKDKALAISAMVGVAMPTIMAFMSMQAKRRVKADTKSDWGMQKLREAEGLDRYDTSKDKEIQEMSPKEALRALCRWEFGDPTWAGIFIEWAEACGYSVTEKK